jgi:hypothetical protein
MVKNLAQQGVINRYIWLVYVYFSLSTDFDYPRQFSPPLPRIIESLLYLRLQVQRTQLALTERANACLRFHLKMETESSLRNLVF